MGSASWHLVIAMVAGRFRSSFFGGNWAGLERMWAGDGKRRHLVRWCLEEEPLIQSGL